MTGLRRCAISFACVLAPLAAAQDDNSAKSAQRAESDAESAAAARRRQTRMANSAEHQPVDPAVADRGALAGSARIMPYDLAQPQGFDRVYRAPGNSGKFFRASGALYAVFDDAVYRRDQDGRRVASVPPGTVYYIGRPDWADVVGVAGIGAGSVDHHAHERAKDAATAAAPRDPAARNGERSGVTTAPTAIPADLAVPVAPDRPREFASAHHDVAAITGRVPDGVDRSLVVGEGAEVRPRIVVDLEYRKERLSRLFQMAQSRIVGE